MPAPATVKHRVLLRWGIPSAPWLETGTFRGDTAEFLSKNFPEVVTLEPMQLLYERAAARFAANPSVRVLNMSSEDGFIDATAEFGGAINFWLDGHFSGVETFTHGKGTPITHEVRAITGLIQAGKRVAGFIDDVRLFAMENPNLPAPDSSSYPPLSALVEWAQENRLVWWIEHDIFIAISSHP